MQHTTTVLLCVTVPVHPNILSTVLAAIITFITKYMNTAFLQFVTLCVHSDFVTHCTQMVVVLLTTQHQDDVVKTDDNNKPEIVKYYTTKCEVSVHETFVGTHS